MILRTETVDQVIDREHRGSFIKEVVMAEGAQPLGMVRKRVHPSAGTRGAVLLIHGFGQNRYTWHVPGRSFSNYLASRGWDVFNLDLRGHGRSRRFGAPRPTTLDEHVREDVPTLAREAMRLSGRDRVSLVGHSMGGLIAYTAAATSLRECVGAVVSIGSPYRWAVGSRTLAGLTAVLMGMRFTGMFDNNPPLPLRIVGRELRRQRRLWDARGIPIPLRAWMPGSVEGPVLDEYLRLAFDLTSLQVAFDVFRWGQEAVLRSEDGRVDYRTAFESLDVPLLVIAGSEDSLAPPASVRPAYERSGSSDKSYRVFPFGHVDLIVGREAPETVWPLVDHWLEHR